MNRITLAALALVAVTGTAAAQPTPEGDQTYYTLQAKARNFCSLTDNPQACEDVIAIAANRAAQMMAIAAACQAGGVNGITFSETQCAEARGYSTRVSQAGAAASADLAKK